MRSVDETGGSSASSSRNGDDKIRIPDAVKSKLEEHGIDVDQWKNGGWKNWDKDKWLSEAKDFVNPVIAGPWKPERMKSAKDPDKTISAKDAAADQGVSGNGGWYLNIAFVPAYNDQGRSESELRNASAAQIAPYGEWWADWASTSNEWIAGGDETGGAGAPYDYALLHVKPAQGSKSLEETVGNALDVDFSAPSARDVSTMGAWGYPAAPPYNGLKMFKCVDRPGRLSLSPSLPTMYRIGCTMTGGSSGGGWFRVVGGKTELVSNTSIGPAGNTWLAGPQLGRGAQALYENMSKRYGGR